MILAFDSNACVNNFKLNSFTLSCFSHDHFKSLSYRVTMHDGKEDTKEKQEASACTMLRFPPVISSLLSVRYYGFLAK